MLEAVDEQAALVVGREVERPDDPVVGQVHVEAGLPVIELDAHGVSNVV